MNAIIEKAYAKINLYLNVTSKREDGFHEIRTVMHSVSLCDDVKVSIEPAKETTVSMIVYPQGLPTDDRNLCVIAAKEYLRVLGLPYHVAITLNKRIPIAGGLAGGSSDAAATLRAINRLLKMPLGKHAMMSICEKIGSDVSYCYFGKTAFCLGRGEKIERLNAPQKYDFVICTAGEHVSTPVAYSQLDALFGDFSSCQSEGAPYETELLECLENGKELPRLYNVFENSVLPSCKGAQTLKKRLLELGATSSLMSGSGPSVFGVFQSQKEAEDVSQILQKEGFTAYAVTSI